MHDTETWAERDVGGGKLYLRRPSANDAWEINFWERAVNARTAATDGVLLSQRLDVELGSGTYPSPDAAAEAVRQILAD